jgi:hypothetical protein
VKHLAAGGKVFSCRNQKILTFFPAIATMNFLSGNNIRSENDEEKG